MKVLIRNKESGLFYTEVDRLTPNAGEAHDFKWSSLAIQWVGDHGLPDAELVYDFENGREMVTLPILDVRRPKTGTTPMSI